LSFFIFVSPPSILIFTRYMLKFRVQYS
jgi:hypothetical protein